MHIHGRNLEERKLMLSGIKATFNRGEKYKNNFIWKINNKRLFIIKNTMKKINRKDKTKKVKTWK